MGVHRGRRPSGTPWCITCPGPQQGHRPGGRKLPPRPVLDQEDRGEVPFPDATLGTRWLSPLSSKRTRYSPSRLLMGEPTLGAGGGTMGTAPPQAPVPLASEIGCRGLQQEPERDIPQESRAQPGWARHSAPTPSGPCLPGRWALGPPGGFASMGFEPGQQTKDARVPHLVGTCSRPQTQWPRTSMWLPAFGTCPPRGHLGPVLSSLASPLRSLQARPGQARTDSGRPGKGCTQPSLDARP